jgi:hypothetical protein
MKGNNMVTIINISTQFEDGQYSVTIKLRNEAGKILEISSTEKRSVLDLEPNDLVHLAQLCVADKVNELRNGVVSLDESSRRQAGKLKSFFGEETFMKLWQAPAYTVLQLMFPAKEQSVLETHE